MCSLYAQDITFHMTQTSIALIKVLITCSVVVEVSFMFQLFISKFNTHYPEYLCNYMYLLLFKWTLLF